jgi:hypothetical protein
LILSTIHKLNPILSTILPAYTLKVEQALFGSGVPSSRPGKSEMETLKLAILK